jgi:hypothetical protein
MVVPRLCSASFEPFRITNPTCAFLSLPSSSTAAAILRQRATTCDDVRRRATTRDDAWTCYTPGVSSSRGLRRVTLTSQGFKTQACTKRATDHRLFPLGSIIVFVVVFFKPTGYSFHLANPTGNFLSLGQSHGEFLVTWPIPRGISCAPVPCNCPTTLPTSWRNVPATGKSGASPS